jgi:hypothetical protein
MKLFISVFGAALLLTSSIAFAAKYVAEPTLPSDIETAWEKTGIITCTKYPGKTLVGTQYRKATAESLRSIIVFTLNGQKIDQREWSKVGESPPSRIRYVKNSPENNWYEYKESESAASGVRMRAELGLTNEELASCNK